MILKDAVVFITGANRGLGLAFAKEALKRGARKVYAGMRNPESFGLAIPGLEPVRIDVTDPESILSASRACADATILVNNAGIVKLSESALTHELVAQSRDIFETNYYGVVQTTQAFVPVLRRNGSGAVVNVLSDAAWVSVPMLAAYAASKHAAWSFTNALRIEVAAHDVQVLGLHVGFLDTDMTAGVDVPKSDPNFVAGATWDALIAGEMEILADQGTTAIKQSLSTSTPAYLNPVMPF